MRVSLTLLLALACAAIAACDTGVSAPPSRIPVPASTHAFASLELQPDVATLPRGTILALGVTARDQSGNVFVDTSATLTYLSSDTTIATVKPNGLMTAIALGSVSISATMTIGGVSHSATMKVTIAPATLLDTTDFSAGTRGWQPNAAYVATGGVVRWSSPPLNWTGMPNTRVYLLTADTYAIVDSVELHGGVGLHKFTTPGVVPFCSGGCWDPPDFGVVYVQAPEAVAP